jgi:hypothetical protein
MTLPFHPRPDDPDADHLNTLLDAMRSGTRAPDAASPESTEAAGLADAEDQLRGLVHRADAPAAAYLDRHPLQNRWESIMSTAFPAEAPNTATGEAFAPSAPVSNRRRRAVTPQPPHRLNAWLSAAIVAVMLLGTIGGAWWLGPGSNGSDDNGLTRLAAVTQDDSTPAAIWPEPLTPDEAPWVAAISPEEYSRDSLSQDSYAAIMTTVPDLSARSPFVIGPAEPSLALEATLVTRSYVACGNDIRSRAYESPTRLFYASATVDNRDTIDAYARQRAEAREKLQAAYGGSSPDDFHVMLPGVLPEAADAFRDDPQSQLRPYYDVRFDPAYVLEMEKGQLAVPAMWISWEGDPFYAQADVLSPPDPTVVYVYVLIEINSEWFVDDMIDICIGTCDLPATPQASPVSTQGD